MNTHRKIAGTFAATLAVIALGGLLEAAVAASAPPTPADNAGPEGHGSMHGRGHGPMHGHGTMMGGPVMEFMHVLHGLELSDAQRDKVHALLREEHEKMGPAAEGPPADFVALGNPGDPKHAAAVEGAKQRAVEHVQHFAELEQKVYALLTPEQQARLPKLLADEQKQLQERRAEHEGHEGHDAAEGHGDHEGHDGPPRH
jgi:Spy/CpxP family protein refolding chaperone